MGKKTEKLQQSHSFLLQASKTNLRFTAEELSDASGWKLTTTRSHLTKRLRGFLDKIGDTYTVDPSAFPPSEEVYIRIMSQVYEKSSNPDKSNLPEDVERLLKKARESAILAIDIYNRPATEFRSQGYIVMMIIAWTSLMHAIFEINGTDYFYRNKDKSLKLIDGESKAWELAECLKNYTFIKEFGKENISDSVKANIELFIGLRNKIEHRFSPEVDLEICGECQALLLNFESIITSNFGDRYSLNSTLTIPLQVITAQSPAQLSAKRKFQSTHYMELKNYIDEYRRKLPSEIFEDMNFCFRVFLVPKIGNHASSSDLSIEFIKYDSTRPELTSELDKFITLTREKYIPVLNPGSFKPSKVSSEVAKRINRIFRTSEHTRAWGYYSVRKKGYQADGCKTQYCQYDVAHNDYVYTQEWVEFLVSKLSQEDEYNKVMAFVAPTKAAGTTKD